MVKNVEKDSVERNDVICNKLAGLRCDVCIGCGLCPGVSKRADVLCKHLPVLRDEEFDTYSINNNSNTKYRLVAVDIGTTTIAMQLFGNDGKIIGEFARINPQCKYGADVLSRIKASGDKNKALEMKKMVEDILYEGFSDFKGKISEDEELFAVIASNVTMYYLLMGWDATGLGTAPFVADKLKNFNVTIAGVNCLCLGGFSTFVGGDIRAGAYACGMDKSNKNVLLIDLGTNGEILLSTANQLIGCATAAGPAFEGGPNKGIWGADMISCIANLLDRGIVDDTGLLCDEYFDSGISIGNVYISQDSIRAIQLAKAAIRTGIDMVLTKAGLCMEDLEMVVLAGGFGYYLNPKDAVRIKMLPSKLLEKTVSGANTALRGAWSVGRRILSDYTEEEDINNSIEGILNKLETDFANLKPVMINLAEDDVFNNNYIENINF